METVIKNDTRPCLLVLNPVCGWMAAQDISILSAYTEEI